MSYKMKITDTTTGQSVITTQPGDWSEDLRFFWTDGNFGCDCNRGREFMRANGLPPGEFACSSSTGVQRFEIELLGESPTSPVR